ncbi:hypothetical protein ACQ4PT_013376 [Festuca glaucescens]
MRGAPSSSSISPRSSTCTNGWRRALADVRPYYAVKCNPEPALLGALATLDAGFDSASRREIEAVVALGVKPGLTVYANPCKPESDIKYAAEVGVNLTTYDSEEEVAKVQRWHPGCELILRIKGPENAEAKIDLGTKYGAHADEVVPLLSAAQRAGLNVAGVSFHVGDSASRTDAATRIARPSRPPAASSMRRPPLACRACACSTSAAGSRPAPNLTRRRESLKTCWRDTSASSHPWRLSASPGEK